jgi:DNA-binding PadR family transcriptional regulator
VRAALLALLAERPMHGYEMISELAERTGGAWVPSPGAVYPALQLLTDKGLVDSETDGGRRQYMLTGTGRQAVEDTSFGTPPWEAMSRPVDPADAGLREAAALIGTALAQVIAAGTGEQKSHALEILWSARRALYRILAEDEPDPET